LAAIVGDPDDHAGAAVVAGPWRVDGRCGTSAFVEGELDRIEGAVPDLAQGGQADDRALLLAHGRIGE
jgi:hypothetical protein